MRPAGPFLKAVAQTRSSRSGRRRRKERAEVEVGRNLEVVQGLQEKPEGDLLALFERVAQAAQPGRTRLERSGGLAGGADQGVEQTGRPCSLVVEHEPILAAARRGLPGKKRLAVRGVGV